jgi:carbon starvation protein
VAALALIVVTVLLMKLGKPIKYTFYPAVLMLITTIGALIYQVRWQFIPEKNYLLAAIGVLLIVLAVIMTAEGIATARKLHRPPAEPKL